MFSRRFPGRPNAFRALGAPLSTRERLAQLRYQVQDALVSVWERSSAFGSARQLLESR